MGVNIKISEGQVDNLIKQVLVEERKKQILLEDTVWERTPPGKPKDPIGYWKILFDQLKKGGIGVKWEVTNDPVKSTFMYWGMWVIWKDINKGVVWQDPKTKKTYKFKWDGGKYAGQSAENIKLIYGTTKFNLLDYSKSSPETILSNLNKISGRDSVWIDLGQKLNSYKPKTTTYFEGKDSHVVVYPGTKLEDKKQLEFKKDGTIWFTDNPGSVKNNGAKWDKKSIKDGKLAGGWLINNLGKKVSLGDALSEPELNFGTVDSKLSSRFWARRHDFSLWLFENKWFRSLRDKCDTKSLPSFASPKQIPRVLYCLLENNPPPKFIAYVIRDSENIFSDDEAHIEAAFIAIKNLQQYKQVEYYLGEDPYKYVSKFMPETNKKFYKIPVQKSYERIIQSTISKKDESKNCLNVKLTSTNPAGLKHNNNFQDLIKIMSTGYYENQKINTVPNDFGWNNNNDVYPKPILYTQKEIDSCQLTVNTEYKMYPETKVVGSKEYDKYSETTAVRNIPSKEYRFAPQYVKENNIKLNEMKTFNFILSQQKSLIPKYCKREWSKTFNYYDKEKIKNPNNRNIVTGTHDVDKMATFSIPYSELCKDFGGLWVFGVGTNEYQCFCRDYSHPYLVNDLEIKPFSLKGYEVKPSENKVNFVSDNKKSTNWSTDDNKIFILSMISFAAAVFTPTIIATIINVGVSMPTALFYYKRGDYKKAALEVLFTVISVLNKIPGIKDMDIKYFKRAIRHALKNETMPYFIIKGATRVLQATEFFSKGVKKGLEALVGQEAVKSGKSYQILIQFVKESEKLVAKQLGLTKKNLASLAIDL